FDLTLLPSGTSNGPTRPEAGVGTVPVAPSTMTFALSTGVLAASSWWTKTDTLATFLVSVMLTTPLSGGGATLSKNLLAPGWNGCTWWLKPAAETLIPSLVTLSGRVNLTRPLASVGCFTSPMTSTWAPGTGAPKESFTSTKPVCVAPGCNTSSTVTL